jgi:hypothetical protein
MQEKGRLHSKGRGNRNCGDKMKKKDGWMMQDAREKKQGKERKVHWTAVLR